MGAEIANLLPSAGPATVLLVVLIAVVRLWVRAERRNEELATELDEVRKKRAADVEAERQKRLAETDAEIERRRKAEDAAAKARRKAGDLDADP